jgi:hypothetical protein
MKDTEPEDLKQKELNDIKTQTINIHAYDSVSKNANELFKYKYDTLNNGEQAFVKELITKSKSPYFTTEQLIEGLKANGYKLLPKRSSGNNPGLYNIKKFDHNDIFDIYTGKKYDDIELTANKEFPLKLKKLENIVIQVLKLAAPLNQSKFNGASSNDLNEIRALYDDMKDKMFIITSLNYSNEQMRKLRDDFDKLYKLVIVGINSYIPPTMSGGGIFNNNSVAAKYIYTPSSKVKTQYLSYL